MIIFTLLFGGGRGKRFYNSVPHVQQEVSSLCKSIILLLCGVSISVAIVVAVVVKLPID